MLASNAQDATGRNRRRSNAAAPPGRWRPRRRPGGARAERPVDAGPGAAANLSDVLLGVVVSADGVGTGARRPQQQALLYRLLDTDGPNCSLTVPSVDPATVLRVASAEVAAGARVFAFDVALVPPVHRSMQDRCADIGLAALVSPHCLTDRLCEYRAHRVRERWRWHLLAHSRSTGPPLTEC